MRGGREVPGGGGMWGGDGKGGLGGEGNERQPLAVHRNQPACVGREVWRRKGRYDGQGRFFFLFFSFRESVMVGG